MGKGLASKGSYKIDTTGSFSDLLLDLEQLLEYSRLYGLDNKERRVINTRVDDGKYKNILCNCHDATSLVQRLELLIASIESGNTSDELVNEGMTILDTLLEHGDIMEEQHEGIYRKYFE